MNELELRLERHGDKIMVYGARGSYSANISRSEQTQVYFDLLTRAVQAEHEETMTVLKVKTKELYLAKAINEGHLRKDRDALESFQNATRGFKRVLAENMSTSWPDGREIILIKEKVGLFVNELRQIGITACSEGIVNGNLVRISMQPKGFIDVYSTRRRQPSEPYIHGFDDLELQQRIETLWEDFLARLDMNKTLATEGCLQK